MGIPPRSMLTGTLDGQEITNSAFMGPLCVSQAAYPTQGSGGSARLGRLSLHVGASVKKRPSLKPQASFHIKAGYPHGDSKHFPQFTGKLDKLTLRLVEAVHFIGHRAVHPQHPHPWWPDGAEPMLPPRDIPRSCILTIPAQGREGRGSEILDFGPIIFWNQARASPGPRTHLRRLRHLLFM
ncbi:hypothetical protein GX48_06503 [Paracoccidioides brasiliensis]|nr:hypothetical protein GX48_06503 [Paracoccidioides brasiliensis]